MRRRCQDLLDEQPVSTEEEIPGCCLKASVEHFGKLILPPPLPFVKKRKPPVRPRAIKQYGASDEGKEGSITTQKASSGLTASDVALTPISSSIYDRPFRASLIDLARMQNWQGVLEHANRREAKYCDIDGLYALHWAAAGGPPVDIVHVLLRMYPSAAKKADKEGSTPLHFACHYSGSVDVISALLQAYPKAIRVQDRCGRTPLYHAVDKSASIDVLKLLVRADPNMCLKPCLRAGYRNVPLDRKAAVRTPLFLAWSAVVSDRQVRTKFSGKKWDKAEVLLQASSSTLALAGGSGRPNMPYRLLPAAIRMDLYLPEQVISIASQARPHELAVEDPATGQLPLSLAASTAHYSRERSLFVIRSLLDAFPKAAKIFDSARQRSALSHAIASGKRWHGGVEDLFRANPEALIMRDSETGLVPALLQALADELNLCDIPSTSETSKRGVVHVEDPYNLLSPKQQGSLRELTGRRGHQKVECKAIFDDRNTEHIDSIYSLLRSEPSVLFSGIQCQQAKRHAQFVINLSVTFYSNDMTFSPFVPAKIKVSSRKVFS